MDQTEIRLRLIEAAARNPDPRHAAGFAASVVETATTWEAWVNFSTAGGGQRPILGVPKKGQLAP